jgi:hypothetical protein
MAQVVQVQKVIPTQQEQQARQTLVMVAVLVAMGPEAVALAAQAGPALLF